MGLIKALTGAVGGVLADQWREHFVCNSLSADVLAAKGQKSTSNRSSNTKGEDNVISNGSIIEVNEGQCMMIVEQGAIVEFCAEPGQFIFDSSKEPSIFYGKFGQNLLNTFKTMGKRISMGGAAGIDQRVYYFNTKEIVGNKYGTPNAVPFRVVDNNIGLDIDIAIRCHGEFSYKITDPMLFYKNVCGNVADIYTRAEIDSQLKTELMTALQPAFAKISAMGIRYSALPGHTIEISNALNEVLSEKWGALRGLAVASFGVSSVSASEEDEELIKKLQRDAVFRNPTMAAARLAGAQAEAMESAAKNEGGGGAFMAFAGMNMAQNAGGMNMNNLYAMGQQQQPAQQAPAASAPAGATWTCECGASGNVGKFCGSCGAPKKEEDGGWKCACGTFNKGKFCAECGAKRPEGAKAYRCNKCGWEPQDKSKPPKFCIQCGDPFDQNDIV
ncbi:MAG: SPFH domain-containing protein [Clostridia bacterium]|nr:SPFH domain-containing protein [Clostridia bacterium]